jgi:protein-tyrosine phosphatase
MGNMHIKTIMKNIYWSIYGRTISNPVLPSNIKSILFVCKGNICRSPFAEHYASKYFSASNQLLYYSVGIKVEYPKPPPIEAIVSAKNFGIDLHDHKSREINYRLMEEYDLIIVMETWQHKYLRRNFRSFKNKIFLLPLFKKQEVVPDSFYNIYNIRDPYGKNVAEFDKCFRDINNCLDGLFSDIKKTND